MPEDTGGLQGFEQPLDQADKDTDYSAADVADGSMGRPTVRQAQFGPIVAGEPTDHRNPLELVLDVEVQVTVELGRANLQVRDILELGPGAVVELDKLAGEPVEVLINNKPYARGEVVVIDENFGVRVSEIMGCGERAGTVR